MRVRQATGDDLERLKEIVDLSFPRFFRYFALHSVSDLEEPTLVAEVDTELAGFVKLTQFRIRGAKYGCILWIAVHPHHRRQGNALTLTNASVKWLKDIGAKFVFASTQFTNKAAQTTLKKAGFAPIGFFGLWRLFSWHVMKFYSKIWFIPGELVFML